MRTPRWIVVPALVFFLSFPVFASVAQAADDAGGFQEPQLIAPANARPAASAWRPSREAADAAAASTLRGTEKAGPGENVAKESPAPSTRNDHRDVIDYRNSSGNRGGATSSGPGNNNYRAAPGYPATSQDRSRTQGRTTAGYGNSNGSQPGALSNNQYRNPYNQSNGQYKSQPGTQYRSPSNGQSKGQSSQYNGQYNNQNSGQNNSQYNSRSNGSSGQPSSSGSRSTMYRSTPSKSNYASDNRADTRDNSRAPARGGLMLSRPYASDSSRKSGESSSSGYTSPFRSKSNRSSDNSGQTAGRQSSSKSYAMARNTGKPADDRASEGTASEHRSSRSASAANSASSANSASAESGKSGNASRSSQDQPTYRRSQYRDETSPDGRYTGSGSRGGRSSSGQSTTKGRGGFWDWWNRGR